MRIWRLAFADIKKNKSLTATLLFLSFLAALFLSAGLLLQEITKTAYPTCAERIKSPDMVVITEGSKYKSSYEGYFKQDERVKYVEKEEVIYMESINNSANTLKAGAVIFNKDTPKNLEPMPLLKEDTSVPREKAIYLPKIMEDSGASLGQPFTLTYQNTEYEFLVAGFFETSYMGITTGAFMKYYIPNDRFLELYETTGIGKALSVQLKDGLPKVETSKELKKDFLEDTNYFTDIGGMLVMALCLSYYDMQDSINALLSIPMMILISMAFIIGVINAITVYFKVKESIDENMTNIGSLQAMGYTTGQILRSKTAEFAALGLTGGIAGTAFVYAILPMTLRYSQGIVGIVLNQNVNLKVNVLSAAVILIIMTFSAILGAWKIRKISPVTALRKGVRTHHFEKNLFPLQKGSSSVYVRLALKNFCSDAGRSVTTTIIVGLGVFAIALSAVLYINFSYDKSALVKMTGIEVADVLVIPVSGTDIPEFKQELETMPEVRKISQTESYMAKIGEDDIQLIITDDFDKMEIVSVSKGNMPEYDNEIALTAAYLSKYNKEIGDTVELTVRGITKEYLIVGSSMGTNNGGKMGLIRLDGIRRVDPYFSLNQINIYLKNKAEIKAFMDKIYTNYGTADTSDDTQKANSEPFAAAAQKAQEQIKKMLDQYGIKSVSYAVMQDGKIILAGDSKAYKIKEVSSLSEYLDGQLASYTIMMNGIMGLILAVMLIVMGTIISITVKSIIRSKREEFGIYKSMGYTTRDIVKIIRLQFTVNAIAGSALGILCCRLFGNRILSAFFSNLGIGMDQFKIKTIWLAAIAFITVIYICALSTYKAYQVRKITVYELLTE